MILTILILTHKRPILFKRCLESVLNILPENVEIIVNNDSNDIKEIQHKQVKYFYKQSKNLSDIYSFLLKQSKGEYIYYLEDDDYLHNDFFNNLFDIIIKYDLICGNYYPTYKPDFFIKAIKQFSLNKPFCIDKELMQLGQFIFKRNLIIDFDFPNDSHIHNDYKLVQHSLSKHPKILTLSKVFYFQTTDGGDNISFPESTNYYGY